MKRATLFLLVAAALAAGFARLRNSGFATAGRVNFWNTGPNTVGGTWTAIGAVEDSGTYTEAFELSGQTVHGVKTLVGARGTITIEARARIVFTSPTTAVFEDGNWLVVDGTDAYAALHAEGSPAGTGTADFATGTVTVAHDGLAHYDGDNS
jgi:hypothetical protein